MQEADYDHEQHSRRRPSTGSILSSSKFSNLFRRQGKSRLLLMGLKRSGKSSIANVVFHKLPPSETLYLETTTAITKDSVHTLLDFQIWDFPAQLDLGTLSDVDNVLEPVGSIIFVIDAQDEYFDAIARLVSTVMFIHQTHPSIHIGVFVHKVDSLSEDFRLDVFRNIQQHIQDELTDGNLDRVTPSFYQTSIYDHSVFEAFSRVVQKLIVQLPALESLLNTLCSSSRIEKAYLFDVLSKIYIASDTTPGDIIAYETCSDYIDVIVDISEIYGWDRPADGGKSEYGNQEAESLITMEKKGAKYLYLREVNQYLALVCIVGEDDPQHRKAAIDYNVGAFQKALAQIFHDE
ncbi:MAG: hypothetical protein Q9162_002818 [Coniocarpon cinnabarinum]